MVVILMGVSGCGKSAVGKQLANRLDVPFYDADAFHSAASIAKMKEGIPLNDDDRLPWLRAMADAMPQWEANGGAVLACSALKRSYRAILRQGSNRVVFVHLHGARETILKRMEVRNHFFPLSLLDSQFAALEPPDDAIVIDIEPPIVEIVEAIFQQLNLQ